MSVIAPPLEQGAIVVISSDGTKRSLAFQYNPDSLRRTVEPNTVGGRAGSRSQAVRFAGAAAETITLDCRFSAVDAVAPHTGVVQGDGIAPQLAALAMLGYPRSSDVLQAQQQLDGGTIEVVPTLAPRLLFVWGGDRVVPVQLTSATIVEELYDRDLVPILATVTLTLRAVSYSDVDETNPQFNQFIAYQQKLESLAAQAYTAGGGGQGA
jgi:hypothetical protein